MENLNADKKVLVTGASGGIGRAIAVEAAKAVSENAQLMVDNAGLWHVVDGATKPGLHAINESLANNITKLTGNTASYTSSTGIWQIGGNTLQQYAQGAKQTLSAAQESLSKLISTTTGFVMGGLGTTGLGVILPNRKRSEAYTKISDAVRVYSKKYREIDEKDIDFLVDLQDKLQYVEDLKKEESKLINDKIDEVIIKWLEFNRKIDEEIMRERMENEEEEELNMEQYEERNSTRSGGRR